MQNFDELMRAARAGARQATAVRKHMARPPMIRASLGLPGELVVDSFAGGGGASTGIEQALGRPVDIAINHDPEAIAMHQANHPHTRHYLSDVWEVDPLEATNGKPVGLAWFSPDCKHFSRAKGSQLRDNKIRGLAWVVIHWVKRVRPRIIILENVCEFDTWGPLDPKTGRPCAVRKGQTFKRWLRKLKSYGYNVEYRYLVASDYGAPTIRKRLYLVARCDGLPIVWPEPTHGTGEGLKPYIPVSDILQWELPCPSIFERERQLKDDTLRRVAEGVRRFVIDAQEPFIVRHGHYSTKTGAGIIPGRGAGTWRGQRLSQPMSTICATEDRHLVVPHIAKHYGGVVGHDVNRAIGTITARDHHSVVQTLLERAAAAAPKGNHAEAVYAFISKYYGNAGAGHDVRDPMHTLTGKDRFALVKVHGQPHKILDIGMRMLKPREQYRGQGFPDSYVIDEGPRGEKLPQSSQTRMAGNSVCPAMSEALAVAQLTVSVRQAA